MSVAPPPRHVVRQAVTLALAEDLGRAGDITSLATIDAAQRATAVIVVRAAGTIAGMPLVDETFAQLGSAAVVEPHHADGTTVAAGTVVATLRGSTRDLLAGERTALNFLGHLSGIATATRTLVDAVAGTRVRIADTRKTTPGLRALEKYAVRCGGGMNHRFGLDDAVLIKDNHIAAAGGVTRAVEAARAAVGHMVRVEIEVDTLAQLEEALAARADLVLVDNMSPEMLREAVRRVDGRARVEASGGIARDGIRAVAETGVDIISSGWITHSAPRLDVALDIVDGV